MLKLSYCKTLYICRTKFSRFNENDILAYFNFGGHVIPSHRGDSNGMPQCIVSWIVKKISQYSPGSPFYLRLDYGLHNIGGLIVSSLSSNREIYRKGFTVFHKRILLA